METIRQKFMSHDDDGSGTVNTDELGEILHDMGVELSHDVLSAVLADIDHDGTGHQELHCPP